MTSGSMNSASANSGMKSAAVRVTRCTGVVLLCLGFLCAPGAAETQKKAAKKSLAPQLPPLPSGPTGPVPQIPLDSIAPVAPQVSYEKGQLTIVASNSTLGDILRAVRKQTGAEIEVPEARERVVTHLGPGPAREVIADLLNGSRFNYVLLGSSDDSNVLTRVVLVQKSPDATAAVNMQASGGPSARHPNELAQPGNQDALPDADAEAPEETADENADQQQPPAEAEQPVANPDQPGVKTPQQLLQEMQQRQLQMQQQQQTGQPGQPPTPYPGPVQQQPQPPQQQ